MAASADRCEQENLIAQIGGGGGGGGGGARALSAPVDSPVSNWAYIYMVMTSLAWTLKAWSALLLNVYTDPRLLDVQGAVESLPEFTVTNDPNKNRQCIAAGAESLTAHASNLVAPAVALTPDFSGVLPSTPVTLSAISMEPSGSPEVKKLPRNPLFLGSSQNRAGGI